MNKFLALIPFFCFAACSAIKIDYTNQASAGETGGSGGSASVGSGMGGSAGNAAFCTCESEVEKDGERLKRQYLIGEDGSKMSTMHWTDTQLNDVCVFQSLPSGETRCVPPSQPMNAYRDSACTKPMFIQTNPCVAPAKYARIDKLDFQNMNACGTETLDSEYYVVDANAEIVGPISWYAFNANGACVGQPTTKTEWHMFDVYWLHNVSWFVEAKQGVGF